jgi:hypothetical protein
MNLNEVKKGKIKQVIKSSNFFAEKNRNQRIAEAIQSYSGIDLEKTKIKIEELYTSRAKSAHSTQNNNIQEQLRFLKLIFQTYIYDKYKFVKLKLH